jgi:uncharacterized delta-60 repeat protein
MKFAAALAFAAFAFLAGPAGAVTLSASVSGPGTITGPGGLDCPPTCTVTVPTGPITINAVHAPTAVVKSWPYDDLCPPLQDTCTFTIVGSQAFPVAFEALTPFKLTVRARPQQPRIFFGYSTVSVPTSQWEVEVVNTGSTDQIFPGFQITAPFQHVGSTCGPSGSVIFAGAYCTASTFMNSAIAGYYEGTLSLGGSAVHRLGLSGFAVGLNEKRLVLYDNGTPQPLDTIDTSMGSAAAGGGYAFRDVVLVNRGNLPVAIPQPAALPEPFQLQNNCPPTLGAGGFSCAMRIFFNPTEPGPRTATLTIASDAGTKTVELDGVGERAGEIAGVDPTFNGGYMRFSGGPAGRTYLNRIAFGANGSIYLAGALTIFGGIDTVSVVYKVDAEGLEDPSFGGTFGFTGRQYIEPYAGHTSEEARGIAVLANGKVMLLSSAPGPAGTTDAIVRRLMPDGSPDATFGTAGAVLLAGAGPSTFIVRANGRITVVARSGTNLTATQLTSEGLIDTTFGISGNRLVASDAAADGDIAVRETAAQQLLVAFSTIVGVDVHMAVARLTSNGALDGTFGTAGRSNLSSGISPQVVRDLAVKPDGRVALAFERRNPSNPASIEFAVAQLLASGALDTAFGTSGVASRVFFGYSGMVRAVEALPDGRLLLGGYALTSAESYVPATALFTATGAIDFTWGNAGARLTYVTEVRDMPYDMARDAQGRIVMAGETSALDAFTGARYSRGLLLRLAVPAVAPTTPKPKIDFNADHRGDILWRNTDGRQAIWLMDGIATLETREIIGAASGWTVTQVADLNGDGKSDLVWEHTDGRVAIYLMDGTVPASTLQILNAGAGWTVTHTADLNGDGKADLIFKHTDGTMAAWTMNGTTMTAGTTLLAAGSGWTVIRTGDFNGDGKADLVWQHTDGRLAIWLMDGLASTSTAQLLNAGTGWTVTHTPDLDGDGKSDLVFQNTDGSIALWLMNGTTVTAGATLLGGGTGWSLTHTGDLDADGKADLLFRHGDGRAAIFLMNGLTPTETTQVLNAASGWSVKRVQDMNGDGRADIVWENGDGRTAVWLMSGTQVVLGAGIIGAASGWSVKADP